MYPAPSAGAEKLREEEKARYATLQAEARAKEEAKAKAGDGNLFSSIPGGGVMRSVTQTFSIPSSSAPTSPSIRKTSPLLGAGSPGGSPRPPSPQEPPSDAGFFGGFFAAAARVVGMAPKTDDRMYDQVRPVVAACNALCTVCAGFDEAAHQRKALAIDLMALETIVELTNRINRKHLAPTAIPSVMQAALMLWSDVSQHENPTDNETRKVLALGEDAGANLSGRRKRAITRLKLGVNQFDALTKLFRESDVVSTEDLAADVLSVLTVLIPTVLQVTATRVGIIARSLMLKQIKDDLVETYPLSASVLRAAERMDAGMLSLQLKAMLFEIRLGNKSGPAAWKEGKWAAAAAEIAAVAAATP